MSEWTVSLIFQDDKSNKFWRARCIGNNLEVNFGRVGTQGQSQSKRYESPEDAAGELQKQAREKYKKGYVDGDGGPNASAATPVATESAAAAPAASQCALTLTIGERRLELRLSVDGNAVHTHSVEHYPNSEAAEAAFAQIRAALEADGYRPQ
ncbi:MAG: WGR domain-containing protein [Candidatus Competibacteraceae bacterium]|nr:WGR domain-containing protein [Candidatus Competibacteraceae bacterium]MBK7982561.1 WGR domain-containing protein [Candidatus Competibacteraceae bacterium]MBK8963961.1 WGR domain-containing protein [Candidatus Competibacteraceae bacterium]MBK9951896.1 WGR domain-containing protein [Candidatus Competibacteraceae bacterium]